MAGNVRPRLRDLGLAPGVFPPGPWNAITDVPGVRVGHTTLVRGEGKLVPGRGPVRTGVTAILPHAGNPFYEKLRAAVYVINGSGECTGAHQIEEWGLLESPVVLTNTLSVGTAYDAAVEYVLGLAPDAGNTTWVPIPVVSECSDAYLNDIRGRHVTREDVLAALGGAASGPVPEGSVGAGTGMTAYGFKGGIGTASRRVPVEVKGAEGEYRLGVLVLANLGRRTEFTVSGVPVGPAIEGVPRPQWPSPEWVGEAERREQEQEPAGSRAGGAATASRMGGRSVDAAPDGSAVTVLATDAPLLAHQLRRLCKRVGFGYARTGTVAHHTSGEMVIGFSTANPVPHGPRGRLREERALPDEVIGSFFQAVVEATEEAVLNAVFRADTMVGRDDLVAYGLPIDQTVELLRRHGRPARLPGAGN